MASNSLAPVFSVIFASLLWPIILIAGLVMLAEKITPPAAYAGIALVFGTAIATTYLGMSTYFAIGFVVTLVGLVALALNIRINDSDVE